jgi:hypothetical protein
MNRTLLAPSLVLPCLFLLGANCSPDETFVPPSTTGAGGAAGAAGQPTTTSGPTGTGGATTGSGGGAGAGAAGSGGSSGAGGNGTTAGGAGGMTTGTGGAGGTSGAGGGSSGAAGSAAGTAGAAGTGGIGGADAGPGGAAGMPGKDDGGMEAGGMDTGTSPICANGDCRAVIDTLDGFLVFDPPTSVVGSDGIQGVGTNGQVCQVTENRPPIPAGCGAGTPCTDYGHGLVFKEGHWQLAGPGITTGAMYAVTLHVTGVVECKVYNGNCPRPANAGRNAVFNMWCPGVTDNGDHWNTLMLSVTPTKSSTTPGMGPVAGPVPATASIYMMNVCPVGVAVGHKTWKMDYDATITVPGGSFVNYVEFDTNCREIINCGISDDSGVTCSQQFSITPPTQGVLPPVPQNVLTMQPFASGGNGFGQWMYIDVKSIVPM